ncbi:hypothetical protein Gotur_024602 [Gossypium turneri]
MEGGDSLKKSLAWLHGVINGKIGHGLETKSPPTTTCHPCRKGNPFTSLHGVINGKIGHGLETRVLQGLHVTHAQKGFMRFNFLVPNTVSLVDIIGLLTVYSFANRVTSTVDLNVSYYSTATIQVKSFLFTCGVFLLEEHVEIESKVSANRGKRMHAVVEVRRKGNGEVIAIGKLRMALNKLTPQGFCEPPPSLRHVSTNARKHKDRNDIEIGNKNNPPSAREASESLRDPLKASSEERETERFLDLRVDFGIFRQSGMAVAVADNRWPRRNNDGSHG